MKRILVSGDVVVDNHLYVGERKTPRSAARGTRMARVWGGAKLTEKLLLELAAAMKMEREAAINDAIAKEIKKRSKKVSGEEHKEELTLAVTVDGEPVEYPKKPEPQQADDPADQAKAPGGKNARLFEVDFGLKILGEPTCARNGSFSIRTCANKSETESCHPTCPSAAGEKPTAPPDVVEALHCYATWEPSPKDSDDAVWRVHEALGYGGGGGAFFDFARLRYPSSEDKGSGERHEIIVLDDAGLGFRYLHGDGEKQTCAWPEVLKRDRTFPNDHWIILKMLAPLCAGELWETLKDKCDRLIVVVSVDDIRREDVRVSKAVSWERTATDLIRELKNNHRIKPLLECRHLIIPLRSEGALWFDNGACPKAADGNGKQRWRLFFDNEHQEGEWPSDSHGKEVFGFMSCLMTSLAAHLALPPMSLTPKDGNRDDGTMNCLDFATVTGETSDCIEWGILRGLTGMRALQTQGHGKAGEGMSGQEEKVGEDHAMPGFPFKKVAEAIAGTPKDNTGQERGGSKKSAPIKCDFADIPVPKLVLEELSSLHSSEKSDAWAILTQSDESEAWAVLAQSDENAMTAEELVRRRARRVALCGPSELCDVPCGKYGKYVTPDRNEIEALQSLRCIVRQYKQDSKKATKPLSIAVFGQPGAGKSFAVEQLAKELLDEPHTPTPILTFNLSQFNPRNMETELISALHQVRDKVLEGKLPVVFWDEFDTMKLEWLKLFLAPMNDGKFVDGQITHPIGRCLFVFAGGCFETMADLLREKERNEEEFRNKKGPDFVSRLSGYFDVSGPNQRKDAMGGKDICFPVRRALLMRSVLKLKDKDELDIDRKLLMALLTTQKYPNASRSLERLLVMLCGGSTGKITQSGLPTSSDLKLLIEKVDEFMDMLKPEQGIDAKALELAPQVHAWYCEKEVSRGHEAVWLREYETLRDDIQCDNFAAAKRMARLQGDNKTMLELVTDRSELPGKEEVTGEEVRALLGEKENLERLAEAEHNGWMREKFLNGYRYAKIRDDNRRRHPALRPFTDLDQANQQRDRDFISRIPDFAEKAGFAFVKVEEHKTPSQQPPSQIAAQSPSDPTQPMKQP